MAGNNFWDHSWKSLDHDKRSLYIERFDFSVDPVISFLHERGYNSICDAGCGCGAYALKLAKHGFSVSGFDISEDAVQLAKRLMQENGYPTQGFKCADILTTGYTDGSFDAVVARDVVDHIPIRDGMAAVKELLRIVRPDGCVLMTLDETDEEYESEPHTVHPDGDYLFSGGKWNGMVFHPYSPEEIDRFLPRQNTTILEAEEGGFLVVLEKGALNMDNIKLNELKLKDLQPSQFYISEKKLRDIESWLNPADLSCFEPIPLKLLDGRPVMTDGHTRAVAALRAGLDSVPLVWDQDELSWDMYRACVAACREQGIESPSDLMARIISEAEYREKWDKWCDRMQAELERNRIIVKPYTEQEIPDVLKFERTLRTEENFWGWEIDEAYIKSVTASFHDNRFSNALSFLAYQDERVIGRIDAVLIPSHFDGSVKAYLDWICVLKSCRHQGAAQKLLSALRENLKDRHVDTLIALTASNDEAQRFYKAVPDSEMRDIGIWIDIK